jgi:hypothetical protein
MDADKSRVFSRYVEVVEWEEKVIPSLVRLETFDDSVLDRGKPLFAFSRRQRVDEVHDASGNRKMPISIRRFAVALGKGSSEQIETGPGAVDDRTNGGIDRAWEGQIDLELKEFLLHLRVRIFDQQIWWSTEPGFYGLFDFWDVGSGPIDCGISV